MDVGFIGLGQMGSAIALNLVKAGHRVVVYNRTRAKAEALVSQGAEVAESVADACRRPVADHHACRRSRRSKRPFSVTETGSRRLAKAPSISP